MNKKEKRIILKQRSTTRDQLMQIGIDTEMPLQDHKNIDQVFDYLKPQAQSIYFDRKVEFQNIIDEKKHEEQQMLSKFNRELEKEHQINNYDQGIEKLKEIMNKYDIKHPLRGEDYEEFGNKKEPFYNKILGIVSSNNSFIGYKKDLRQTLDFSEIRSEEYKKKESIKFQKQRTILKYRLYGIEGINEREFQKLTEWGIIKVKDEVRKVKVKKRVKKVRHNSNGGQDFYSSDDSRSCESAYTFKIEKVYESNEQGNPTFVNNGFQIKPLCPTIYGKKAARMSQMRHYQKSQACQHSQRFNTIEVPSTFHSKRMSKTRNQRDRTPIEMPVLKKGHNPINQSFDTRKNLDLKNSQDTLDSIIDQSDMTNNKRNPRKMLMPHLVNKYKRFEHNSISDLYQEDNELTEGSTARFKKGKMAFVNPKYSRKEMHTVTSRLSKTQQDKSALGFKSNVTPRIATQMTNYLPSKSPLKANFERKAIGDGRLNKLFSDRTPKVTDTDIKTLVQKYPIGEKKEEISQKSENQNILAQISQTDIYQEVYGKNDKFQNTKRKSQSSINKENNKKIKQQLEFLGRNIDKMQTQSKKYYRELMTKMVLQNFRDEEMLKIQDFLKELDFAEVESMPGLYNLKMKDEAERLKIIKEVTKDHHEGKLDPTKMVNRVKKVRK